MTKPYVAATQLECINACVSDAAMREALLARWAVLVDEVHVAAGEKFQARATRAYAKLIGGDVVGTERTYREAIQRHDQLLLEQAAVGAVLRDRFGEQL
jgi:hypothetical protein